MITFLKKLFGHITYSRNKFLTQSHWNAARHYLIIKNETPKHTWICEYSGKEILESRFVDIDHIVPLKYAWMHGANHWDKEKRNQLSTDYENLVIASEHENRSKGDDGLLTYLPKINKNFYVTQWEKVCSKYGIKLSEKEKSIINQYKTK